MVVTKTERPLSAARRLACSVHLALTPSHFDLLAACELQHGHVRAAERLSQLAADLRDKFSPEIAQ